MTILVVAGTDDQANLVAGLVEVATQIDSVVGARSDLDIDAVLLTVGGFRLPGDRHEPNVLHAALVGARRALQNEQISVRWRHVDLEPGADPGGWDAAVLTEIHHGEQRLDEIAVRHGTFVRAISASQPRGPTRWVRGSDAARRSRGLVCTGAAELATARRRRIALGAANFPSTGADRGARGRDRAELQGFHETPRGADAPEPAWHVLGDRGGYGRCGCRHAHRCPSRLPGR